MSKATMKNLHVPLPEATYRDLRAEADRTRRPATDVARQAIDLWLAERKRAEVYEALHVYATRNAGTRDDLDPSLEAAGIESLLNADPPKRRRR